MNPQWQEQSGATEPLDFCRVKKIDEKGYGFLKSLYYQRDVFFHFSQIKNEVVKEHFERLKRGDFLIYFTSKAHPDGKRKATRIWYRLADTPAELRPAFAHRIITDFETGRVNIFDLFYAYKELKDEKVIGIEATEKILLSKRLQSVPTTIIPYLTPEEIPLLKQILKVEDWRDKEEKPFWYDEVEKL